MITDNKIDDNINTNDNKIDDNIDKREQIRPFPFFFRDFRQKMDQELGQSFDTSTRDALFIVKMSSIIFYKFPCIKIV